MTHFVLKNLHLKTTSLEFLERAQITQETKNKEFPLFIFWLSRMSLHFSFKSFAEASKCRE